MTRCVLFFIKRWLLLNFNLNKVEAESIISKQFSVLSALQVSLLT